jgi:hypothetical protein
VCTEHVVCALLHTGSVAEHIPYVKNCWGLVNEVVKLFRVGIEINDNIAKVFAWAQNMRVRAYTLYHVLSCHLEYCTVYITALCRLEHLRPM